MQISQMFYRGSNVFIPPKESTIMEEKFDNNKLSEIREEQDTVNINFEDVDDHQEEEKGQEII